MSKLAIPGLYDINCEGIKTVLLCALKYRGHWVIKRVYIFGKYLIVLNPEAGPMNVNVKWMLNDSDIAASHRGKPASRSEDCCQTQMTSLCVLIKLYYLPSHLIQSIDIKEVQYLHDLGERMHSRSHLFDLFSEDNFFILTWRHLTLNIMSQTDFWDPGTISDFGGL